jgi:glucuronoxylan 4-O-methyltransferase
METLSALLAGAYDPASQLSPAQIEVIASVVRARAPGARLLVFGLGHDTPLWQRVNRDGETLFVEHDPAFIATAEARPDAPRIVPFDFGAHASVFGAFSMTLTALDRIAVPGPISEGHWDVILIDGPTGHKLADPGRLLPIHWASRLMRRETHVFLDDYHRALERHFGDLMLRADNPPCAVLAHECEAGKTMLWRIGRSLPPA